MCGEIVCEPPADRALLVKVGLHKVAEVRRGEGEPPVGQQLHKLLQHALLHLVQFGGLAYISVAVVAGGVVTNGGLGDPKLALRVPDAHAALHGRHRLRQLAGGVRPPFARSHFELVVKTTVYYMKKGNVKQFMLPIIHIMTSISI